jgi:hypothetical protein
VQVAKQYHGELRLSTTRQTAWKKLDIDSSMITTYIPRKFVTDFTSLDNESSFITERASCQEVDIKGTIARIVPPRPSGALCFEIFMMDENSKLCLVKYYPRLLIPTFHRSLQVCILLHFAMKAALPNRVDSCEGFNSLY